MLNRVTEARRRRPLLYGVLFGLLPLVIGLGTIYAAHQADAATPTTSRMCTHNPDGSCKWSPAKTARKFRAGYYKKAHGVALSHYFKEPKKVRKVFVRKIHRKIAHMTPKHRMAVKRFITAQAKAHSAGRTSSDPPTSCSVHDWWCLARASLLTTVRDANCRGGQYYSLYHRMCVDDPPEQHFMTTRQVIGVGGAFFCGGSVVIGVVTTPASAGSTAMVAGWGASSCMFSAWAALQSD